MNCPRCRLINPESAVRCDCGYNFETGVVEVVPKETARPDGHRRSRFAVFWPKLVDKKAAHLAARQGVAAALFCSVATAFFSVLGHFGLLGKLEFSLWSLFDAALFGFVAFGIWRRSRAAAVGGLVLYLLERAYTWAQHGPQSPAVAVIIALAFINSVRGTFWLHRDRQQTRVVAASGGAGS